MLFILKSVAFFGVVAFFFFKSFNVKARETQDRFGGTKTVKDTSFNFITAAAGIVCAVLAVIFLSSFGTLRAGERGVVLRLGAVTGRILSPGFYAVVPIIESVHAMNVQVQKEEVSAEAVSRDLQSVQTKVAMNYHLSPYATAALYDSVGDGYKEKLIDPSIQEAMKAVTAKFTAESLVVNRHLAKERTIEELRLHLQPIGISVDGVNITDFDFDPAFKAAIEAKTTSSQLALKAKNDAEIVFNKEREKFYIASADSNVTVAAAKAEAEAIKVQADAIRQQGGQAYVQLKWIEAWQSGGANVPIYMTGSQGQQFLMQMPAYERKEK